jgi:hypothetical protein
VFFLLDKGALLVMVEERERDKGKKKSHHDGA